MKLFENLQKRSGQIGLKPENYKPEYFRLAVENFILLFLILFYGLQSYMRTENNGSGFFDIVRLRFFTAP